MDCWLWKAWRSFLCCFTFTWLHRLHVARFQVNSSIHQSCQKKNIIKKHCSLGIEARQTRASSQEPSSLVRKMLNFASDIQGEKKYQKQPQYRLGSHKDKGRQWKKRSISNYFGGVSTRSHSRKVCWAPFNGLYVSSVMGCCRRINRRIHTVGLGEDVVDSLLDYGYVG
jgi:hypothetical protein